MKVRKCHCHSSSAHFLFYSFKNAHISNDLHIRLRLPVVINPQTEKILSTNACEAGAARRCRISIPKINFILIRNSIFI